MQNTRGIVTPWTVDAKDIEVSDTVENFKKSLFHTNSQIERFLADSSRSEVLVVGPKGFGKTLLLKVKRRQLENSGYTLLPKDTLLDKPIGSPNIYHLREFDSLLSDRQYWRSVWLISITVLLIKLQRSRVVRLYCERLRPVLDENRYLSVCDIFDRIISLPRHDYHLACDDLRATLIPEFRTIHTPIALFIDNIDEYFETAITFKDSSAKGKNSRKEFWYLAQYGLANAARELNSINNHVKICVSIRQEIFQRTSSDDALAIQLHGSAVELRYEKEDLIEIIKKNINAEYTSNLASPRDHDYFARFFGRENTIIEHQYTNEDEYVEDFVLRHTLWRPRDISVIGKRLSEVHPSRRAVGKIRDLVNAQATLIAETYLVECRPHISNLVEEILFKKITGNVIVRDKLLEISKEYDEAVNLVRNTPGHENHVFYDLYCLGLLGFVQEPVRGGGAYQHFQSVGDTRLNASGLVPISPTYLIHPILCDVIAKYNPDFYNNIDSLNIVGRGRPWRDPSDVFFVLKGDVVDYSSVMADADLSDTFPRDFLAMNSESSKGIFHSEIFGGDGILLVDRNWKNLIDCAFDLQSKLLKSVYERKIRFGGDAGVIRFDRADRQPLRNFRGGALRTAARLENVGLDGLIIVTDRFVKYSGEDTGRFVISELVSSDLPKLVHSEKGFNIAKNDDEAAIFHRIFKVDFANASVS